MVLLLSDFFPDYVFLIPLILFMSTDGTPENPRNLPRRVKSLIEREDKATQMPEEEEEMVESDEIEDIPKVGETGWKFLELMPPEELTVILATIWENTEEIYIEDLSQVLFLKRILLSEYMPFVKFVKDHMKIFFNKPNIKQSVLREFQNVYNIFDQDIRSDDDFKAEYHCRYMVFIQLFSLLLPPLLKVYFFP